MAAPLLPKVYDEDGSMGWENKAHKLLQAELGAESYKEMVENQFKDVPDAPGSAMSTISIKMKIIRGLNAYTKATRKGHSSPLPVGGAGFATVVNRPQFPENDFFRPGCLFRVRMRHANFSCLNDSASDGRVVGLKFCDENEGGPLDLVMYTGKVSAVHNSAQFDEYMVALSAGETAFKQWCRKSPSHLYGVIDQRRHLPESYYDQRYYSHVTYELIDHEAKRHMARLRLCPASGVDETGRLTGFAQHKLLVSQTVVAGSEMENGKAETTTTTATTTTAETDTWTVKPKDYLRVEYRKRMQDSALQYRLQIQLRAWHEADHQGANPCMQWNAKRYPWVDLAVVTIALPLQLSTVCKTKMSLLNHPQCFRLPDPTSRLDFFSLGHATSGLHCIYDKPLVNTETKRKYVITMKTGGDENGGTDADVSIAITGTKYRTKPTTLSNPFHDDFEPNQTDVFNIEAVDVGDIIMVEIVLSSVIKGRHWLLDYVSVTDLFAEKTAHFPCYQWLTSSQPNILLRRSEALLANQELNPHYYLHRKYELEKRRKQYQWEKVPGLPSRLKAERYEDIPREARFHQTKERDLKVKYTQALASTGVGSMKSLFDTWDPLVDIEKLVSTLLKEKMTLKEVSIHWKEDAEFGRQLLNGPHPMRIHKMAAPLAAFPVRDEDVYGLLDRGITLREEMKAGHIYMVSYPELSKLVSSINHQPQAVCFVAAPMCMLYVRTDTQLVPIAIQLAQKPGNQPLLFTPKDDKWEWLYAKMWVRLADTQLHQIEARHLKLHLVLEAFGVATMRNLPSVHPVYKLLVPHLRHTAAVNHLLRRSLYPKDDGLFQKYLSVGTHFTELLKETYRRFDLNSMILPKNLEERGVDNVFLLPHYFYRQDGLALWNIIKKFVRTMVMLHYWTVDNVQGDEEIQAWVGDLHQNGLPEWEEGSSHHVPSSLHTLEELIELLTLVIFTASGQNAAVTAPIMDFYGYPANAPTMLVQPPPSAKKVATATTVEMALPSKTKTAEIIAVCYALSNSFNEKFQGRLGDYPDQYFSGDAALAAIEAFREDLKNMTATITERVEKVEENKLFKYHYLSPERLPASVVT